MFKYLIQNGADVNGSLGGHALIKASEADRVNEVKYLIQNGADANEKNSHGFTALIHASKNGFEVVKVLIASGADVNVKNNEGETALTKAQGRGHEGIIKTLKDQARVQGNDVGETTSLKRASKKRGVSF